MIKCKCGSDLIWGNDFDIEDLYDIPVVTGAVEYYEGIVGSYSCPSCNMMVQYNTFWSDKGELVEIIYTEDETTDEEVCKVSGR